MREPEEAHRILFLVNSLEDDAPTRLMTEVACAAASEGASCAFAALSRTGELRAKITDCDIRLYEIAMKSAADPGGYRRLKEVILDFKPDILHVALTRPTIIAAPIARICRVPHLIITQHGIHEWSEGGKLASMLLPTCFRRISEWSDAVISVSHTNARKLSEAGVSDSKTRVIYNGVDTERFHPANRRFRDAVLDRLGLNGTSETVLIGAAGNLKLVKGHRFLLEAAAWLLEKNPDIVFAVWGEGPERESLQQRIQELGIDSRFLLPGRSSRIEYDIAACDIFVQPSLYEAFGMAAAEAMASGVPVVATDCGGLPELITHDKTGVLCKPGDPDSIANSIQELLNEPERRGRIAEAARQHITDRFSIQRMLLEHLTLYREIADS